MVDGRILHQIVEHVLGGLALLLVFRALDARLEFRDAHEDHDLPSVVALVALDRGA